MAQEQEENNGITVSGNISSHKRWFLSLYDTASLMSWFTGLND